MFSPRPSNNNSKPQTNESKESLAQMFMAAAFTVVRRLPTRVPVPHLMNGWVDQWPVASAHCVYSL